MKLRFLGATQQVTGSCFLVECAGSKVLVECGMIQGGRKQEELNRDEFPFDVAEIDAVLITHAHLDHSGRLPLLAQVGYRGPVHAHKATVQLCDIMLRDAAHIAERDAAIATKKRRRTHQDPVEPVYTVDDAKDAIELFIGHAYDEPWQVAPGIIARLRDAGHILGSALIELWLEENGEQRKVVFSGDIGRDNTPILQDPVRIEEADLLLMESTYGNRDHRSWEETWDELGTVINEARAAQGNIMVPAFSVGRAQELLYLFAKFYDEWGLDEWSVFLDSPMAINATQVYSRFGELYDKETSDFYADENNTPFHLPNLRLTPEAEDSMAINRVASGALIIAGSGMCNGGRIRHHFKHNLWRRSSHVIIVGFQAQGTPGRALVDGARELKLWGESVRIGAQIHTVGGLSAHAGRSELIAWFEAIKNTPRVALVHGELGGMEDLAEDLRAKGAEVEVPEYGHVIDLTRLPSRSSPAPLVDEARG
ncbi:MBL fold metallo-hydrolase RNA specificity domain-containing protein [Halorhodospira halochloris]|uniref:MBL fold metallo-hydrolase RNA specificity domain-containing protein n=1 Tax=Halorhodospira halochloris TaxID=1052 RepID=UPI001EE7D167|nr:MBL fold metallo-hydrolase [Halorhodospira halochloris]MCG5549231.1 MBL fold metallo-hydrolase [Halorhodospira halochloris]